MNKPPFRYRWAAPGDVNAFFGLIFDNLANLLLLVMLLGGAFQFPAEFIIKTMVPGTALGVLVGDLAFFWLAFRLARKTGRDNVTAMPLGIDTPSLFGMIFFVLGPSYLAGRDVLGLSEADAALRTWHIGIWCLVLSGLLKLACAPICGWIRSSVPRAGLLGSLAAIALVLISFMPMLDIFAHPLPGLLATVVILTTLIGRIPFPGKLPGTIGALIVAGTVYYLMIAMGVDGYHAPTMPSITWMPTDWLNAWTFGWLGSFGAALPYLPIAFPFAIMTVVGGIDCTESAAAAGDDYDTRGVIAIEGVATLVAGMSGGVIQTTPYIGHPAYKAMGGRAAYSLATALLIGSAGIIGYFELINAYLPVPVVLPILVFIGLEITAQSFAATPRRHYPAVALGCVPALAFLALSFPNQVFGDPASIAGGLTIDKIDARLQEKLTTLTMLSNSFILTSLLWAWALASIIDRNAKLASMIFVGAGAMTLFGLIHSPFAENRLFLPFGPDSWGDWVLDRKLRGSTYEYAAAYFACASLLVAWAKLVPLASSGVVCEHEEVFGGGEAHASTPTSGAPQLANRTLEPEVMNNFDEAVEYDQMDHAAVNRAFVDDLLKGGAVGQRVVDLGTGTALIPIELCNRDADVRVMAIDASVEMLDLAKRRVEIAGLISRIQLVQADAKTLDDLEPKMADAVISNSLIHHLPNPRLAVAAALRIAKPGARIFIRDLARPATTAELFRLVEVHAATATDTARKMFSDSLFAALTLEEARDLFESFGFDRSRVTMTSDRHWTFDATVV